MKHLKQFLLMAMLLFTLAPLQVSAKETSTLKRYCGVISRILMNGISQRWVTIL